MTKLLFIKHAGFKARTVENDRAILEEKYSVKSCDVNTSKGLSFFTALVYQFFFHLFNPLRYKIFFIWFADYHSVIPVFFAKLFGRISVINIGGYDADEILTGNPKSIKERLRKFCVVYSVRNATMLLPVSDVIRSYLESAVPGAKCKTVYCCVDTVKFPPPSSVPAKENLIVTVGGGGEFIKEAKRKRLDFFIELGGRFNELYPEYGAKFFAIGHDPGSETYKYLHPLVSSGNVELKPSTGTVEELIGYYKKASVYMQLSYYEAFGIAQVEAMLYGCLPLSNSGGALKEVVADAGFTVDGYDMQKYIELIKGILDKKYESLRLKAIQRASSVFSLEQRKVRLLEILQKLTESVKFNS